MARPKTNIFDRINRLCRQEGDCRIWTGSLNNGVPQLRPEGTNPQRIIMDDVYGLGLDRRTHVAPNCGNKLCCAAGHLMIKKHTKPRPKAQEPQPPPPPPADDDAELEDCIGCLNAIEDRYKKTFEEICAEMAIDGFSPDEVRAALEEMEKQK